MSKNKFSSQKQGLKQLPHWTIAELSTWLILALLAIVFYRERLLADSSYYYLQVINKQWFHIEHNRLILLLPELLPVVLMKMNVGLKALTISYSIGHLAMFILVWGWLKFFLKREFLAAFVLCLQVLGICQGFFVPIFELYFGIAILLLVFGIALSLKPNFFDALLILFLTVLAATSHQTIVPVSFALGVAFFYDKSRNQKLFLLCIWLIVVAVNVYKHFNMSDYELGKRAYFIDNLRYGQYNLSYFIAIGKYTLVHYLDLVLTSIAVVWMLFKNKQWFLMAFFALSVLLQSAIANLNYFGFDYNRYHEQVYFPITAIIIGFFFRLFYNEANGRFKFQILVMLAIAIRLGFIVNTGLQFKERTQIITQQIQLARDQNIAKAIVNQSVFKNANIEPNWSVSLESLVLSSFKKANTVALCTQEDWNFLENNKPKENDFLFRRWEIMPDTVLNPTYFNLRPASYSPIALSGN